MLVLPPNETGRKAWNQRENIGHISSAREAMQVTEKTADQLYLAHPTTKPFINS